jgi:hypothetical protein
MAAEQECDRGGMRLWVIVLAGGVAVVAGLYSQRGRRDRESDPAE